MCLFSSSICHLFSSFSFVYVFLLLFFILFRLLLCASIFFLPHFLVLVFVIFGIFGLFLVCPVFFLFPFVLFLSFPLRVLFCPVFLLTLPLFSFIFLCLFFYFLSLLVFLFVPFFFLFLSFNFCIFLVCLLFVFVFTLTSFFLPFLVLFFFTSSSTFCSACSCFSSVFVRLFVSRFFTLFGSRFHSYSCFVFLPFLVQFFLLLFQFSVPVLVRPVSPFFRVVFIVSSSGFCSYSSLVFIILFLYTLREYATENEYVPCVITFDVPFIFIFRFLRDFISISLNLPLLIFSPLIFFYLYLCLSSCLSHNQSLS